MAEIKLTYFNLRARGETARMILVYNNIPYNDNRIEFSEWLELKNSGYYEFGQIPVIEIDGMTIPQARDINRYLCQKYGCYPSDPVSIYYTESIVSFKWDIYAGLVPAIFYGDTEERNKYVRDVLPEKLRYLERRLKRNNDGDGWFVGDGPTLGDFEIFQILYDCTYCTDELKAEFSAVYDENSPKLKAYLERFIDSSPSLKLISRTGLQYMLDCKISLVLYRID